MAQETLTSLTKENFWNELEEKYPEPMKKFRDWIDGYKYRNKWEKLFNSDSNWQDADGKNAPAPKYHNLPVAFQIGIFLEYMGEQADQHYRGLRGSKMTMETYVRDIKNWFQYNTINVI